MYEFISHVALVIIFVFHKFSIVLSFSVELRAQLVAGDPAHLTENFARLAEQLSECSSARKQGDLGFFGRGQMQRPFEEATFALRCGELSQPIITDSGVHIILRTG